MVSKQENPQLGRPQSLKDLYPYMFSVADCVSMSTGWFPLFALLCQDIDQKLGPDKYGFHWVQVKEKFGSCRAHFQMDITELEEIEEDLADVRAMVNANGTPKYPDLPPAQTEEEKQEIRNRYALLHPIRVELVKLTNAFASATTKMCIVCGEVGQQDSSGGYLLVLCPKHVGQRRSGPFDILDWWMKI